MSGGTLRSSLTCGSEVVQVELSLLAGVLQGTLRRQGEPVDVHAQVTLRSGGSVQLVSQGRSRMAHVVRRADHWLVALEGEVYEVKDGAAQVKRGTHGERDPFAVSPMTGVLAKMSVTVGQRVSGGAALFVVEAMKMEYVVKAPRDVVISRVHQQSGAQVAQGDVLVSFEEDE